MPHTTNALGVTVSFYDTDNVLVQDVTATLVDERGQVRVIFDSSILVTDSKMSVNSCESSNSKATLKHINLYHETVVGHGPGPSDYPHFVGNQKYSLKMATTLRSTGERIKGKFLVDDELKNAYEFSYYAQDNVKDMFNANANIMNKNEVESIDGTTMVKFSCPLEKTSERFGSENELDGRTPTNVTFTFDEVNDYAGQAYDSKNIEAISASVSVPYSSLGVYEINVPGLVNNRAYYVTVDGNYADGFAISKTLDETMFVIAAPKIMNVEAYGLGADKTDAGDDLNTSTIANIDMKNGTVGTRFNVVNNQIKFSFSQEDVVYYTAEMDILAEAEGATTTYNVVQSNLIKANWDDNIPTQNAGGSYNFDVKAEITYEDGNTTKQSNVVNAEFTTDIIPLSNVYITNAWIAAANVDGAGARVVDLNNGTTNSGFYGAPDFGIVGYFYKTDFFNNPHQLYSNDAGLYQDLDVASTRFEYKISVNDGGFAPVKNIHQIQPTSSKSHQENFIDVINAAMQSDDQGQYANIIPVGVNAGLKGSQQEPVYFRICATPSELFNEDDVVKISVSIIPDDGETTLPGPTESNICLVLKKIKRYTMTLNTLSEPMFADEVLQIPIHAEEEADLYFASTRFQSNLDYPNADIYTTQTDAEYVVVNNPNKRGASESDAIEYTVTYTINDPNNDGTISIESEEYIINVTDEPTTGNFTVTNYNYNTFHNDSESSFTFNVSFTDGATTGIDGIHVYFHSTNDNQDNLNQIAPMLVLNVPRTDGDSQSNLLVMLQDTPASNSDASSSIKVNDIDGNDSDPWLNYRYGTISFVPYKSRRVLGSIIDSDDLIQYNDPEVVDTKPILNIPVIDMPENVLLVGGVVESHTGTRLEWFDNSLEYSNTSVTPSYELVDNDVVVPQQMLSADSSKLSYLVNAAPALSSLKFEIRTKLVSDVDSTVYYSKPVTVEFTSASVDLSGAIAVVKRGSNATTLKAMLNAYAATDASDIETPTGITVFVEPNFVAPTSGWLNPSYVLPPGDYSDGMLATLGLNDHVKSMLIPDGYTVQAWRNNFSGISATYTSHAPETISSISSLRITGAPVGFPKLSNLNVTEYKLIDAGSAENVCIAIQDGVETVLTDAQIDGVIADSSRSIITIDPDVDGWSVKNTYAVNATPPKVNLYYYANAVAASVPPPAPNGDGLNESNSFTLSQATGLGLYAIFYQNQGAQYFPTLIAYTAKTTSGTNKSWYKSKVFYYPADDHVKADTTADSDNVGLTLVYTGTDDGSFPKITRRVKYVVREGPNLTNANVPGYEKEPVSLLSLHTSGATTSSSESYNLRLLETGMFTSHNSFGQLSLRYNVVSDPEHPAIKVLPSSTTAPVQATVDTIHTYNLSQDYQKSDILQLLPRMKAGIRYTEKRGDAIAAAKESQPTYLSLVSGAKVAYTCASSPSVEVVGTRILGAGVFENRKGITLKINANGLSSEGMQSVIIHLLKEGNHTDEDADAQGAEIVLGFESTSGRVRSYTVNEIGADITTGSIDNLGAGETHELTIDNVGGFSETALPNSSTFILVMDTLDDNDASILHLPVGSEWDTGDVTVLAVVSTRIGTDVHYATVSDVGLD
jgi:hypothetical protein